MAGGNVQRYNSSDKLAPHRVNGRGPTPKGKLRCNTDPTEPLSYEAAKASSSAQLWSAPPTLKFLVGGGGSQTRTAMSSATRTSLVAARTILGSTPTECTALFCAWACPYVTIRGRATTSTATGSITAARICGSSRTPSKHRTGITSIAANHVSEASTGIRTRTCGALVFTSIRSREALGTTRTRSTQRLPCIARDSNTCRLQNPIRSSWSWG